MLKALRAIPFLLLCMLAMLGTADAQLLKDPTTWKVEAIKKQGAEYELVVKLTMTKGWHIWSIKPLGDGMQVAPEIKVKPSADVKLVGTLLEAGHKITGKMDGVEGDGIVSYYHDAVTYTQKLNIAKNTTVKGSYYYQVCNDQTCLPPKEVSFSVNITDAGGEATAAATPADRIDSAAMAAINQRAIDSANAAASAAADTGLKTTAAPAASLNDGNTGDKKEGEKSKLGLFLISLGGGFIAIFTPCIFSMIPITVSFFTKRSKTRAEGIRNAIYYSLSIMAIFTILGVLISAVFGASALYSLSSDWRANLFFFILIVIFAISFLGAFEITLPASWTSVTDSRAGVGSFMGIFFMALTLVIVSFSCTGPIVGTLLVEASKGGIAGPAVGMFGFSLGLALPFSLFAIFPGLVNKMASSGGWLNQVKVVLGLIELMLALKFLSNADLAMGWRLLDREIFIAIWIVLSIILGIYLLGKLQLSHDDAPAKNIYGQEYVSIFKLFLTIISFTFAVYLLPGMWGAPLNGMSAFLPPMGTFNQFGGGGGSAAGPHEAGEAAPVKYVKEMKIYEPPVVTNLGLSTYFDYDEAIAASKKLGKPIMLDFTGITCVNCRKMESQVWSQSDVAKRMKEDFIVASLYCDSRIELPESEQFYSKELGQQVTTLGSKNQHLQVSKYGSNAQPLYYYIDDKGTKLAEIGYPYDPDVPKFVAHLDKVKERYKAGAR